MNFRSALRLCTFVVVPLLLVTGCDSSESDDNGGDLPVPNFAIGTQVSTTDSSQNFVAFADELDSTDTLTLGQAIEAGSAGGVFAAGEGTGVFFTAEEGGLLQRWTVSAEDPDNPTVMQDGVISFAGEGLTSFFPTASHIQFIDENKAYLMSSAFGEIIVWDPSSLEITKTITIPGLATDVDGTAGSFSLSGVRSGDQLMFTYNFATPTSLKTESYLVVIDTTDDTVAVDHTATCGDLAYGMVADNGDVYWARAPNRLKCELCREVMSCSGNTMKGLQVLDRRGTP